jgi:predicted ATPase
MRTAKGIGMPWYVLTGAPGAGKTAIIRHLERDGFGVVEEAATDVIALEQALGRPEPWSQPGFTDQIVRLQQRRERLAARAGPADPAASGAAAGLIFFDRSPVCTLALSRFLGLPVSPLLAAEVDRVAEERVYEPSVFFVRNQGFVAPTSARRISFAESLAFEDVHEQTYRELGFALIDVPAGPLADRTALVRREALRLAAGQGSADQRPADQRPADQRPADHGRNQVSGSSSTSGAPADASAPATSVRR